MASFRRLPSGLWQASVRLPGGRRVTRSDPLKGVVRAWAAEEEQRASRGAWRDPRGGRVTVAEWHARWVAARVVSEGRRRGDESVWRLHIEPHLGSWQLAALTRMEVQGWVRRLEVAGVGLSAIQRAFATLRTMVHAAVDEGLLDVSPCQRVALPRVPTRPPEWFTRAEADRILAVLGEPHRTMAALMLWSGLRWGEAAGLTAGRVDWLRGTLQVVGTVSQDGVRQELPKTAGSRREVPVPAHVLEGMAALLAQRPGGADRLVFVTRRSARPFCGVNWRVTWRAALERAGVPYRSPHACRRSAASWLVQDGVSLYDVQRLLGHSSPVMTARSYAALAPGAHAPVTSSWARRVAGERATGDGG